MRPKNQTVQNQRSNFHRSPAELLQYALSLQQAGNFKQAKQQYKKILKREPKNVDALHFMGLLAYQLGKPSVAFDYLNKAIELAPKLPAALNSRGLLNEKHSKLKEALDDYNKALAISPMSVDTLYNRGSLLLTQQNYEQAKIDFDKVLSIKPDHVNALLHRGLAHKGLKHFSAAMLDFNDVLSIKPDSYSALNNRGNLFDKIGNSQNALSDFNQAILVAPNMEEGFINRGCLFSSLKKHDEAIKDFSDAIRINEKSARALNNRGASQLELERFDEAISDFMSALEISPEYADAWNNLGNVYSDLNLSQKALEYYEMAISYNREFADAQFNKSLMLLQMGDFSAGWRLYEWRKSPNRKRRITSAAREFAQPIWLGGENVTGKTIFLHWEQGLGDTIQFCRLAKNLSDRGCKVILEVQKPLKDLMANVEGVDTVIHHGEVIPNFDFHCSLMSLPHALGLMIENIPTKIPYLAADKPKLEVWKDRLGPKTGPRVGIVWSGNKSHRNDHNRSIRLEDLASGIKTVSELYSVQKEIRATDTTYFSSSNRLHHFGDELEDFSDTAALVELMDVIVSVDTSVAHLAGALGKKVFLLLPFAADFRWFREPDSSPWYPEMRLFRQGPDRSWSPVLSRVDKAISDLISC